MKNLSEKSANDLTFSIDQLTFAVEQLTQSLDRTDDFNQWTYADSLASIANSLVKYNSLTKKREEKDTTSKKMSRREFLGLDNK